MSKTDIIEAATPSGIPLRITLIEYLPGSPMLDVELPTRDVHGRCGSVLTLREPRQGATHYLAVGKANVGIDAATAARIERALRDYREAWERTPEGQIAALRSERELLVGAINSAADAITAHKEHAFRLDTGAGWDRVLAAEQDFSAQQAKLRQFDALHPEIRAALNAERAERTRDFLATD